MRRFTYLLFAIILISTQLSFGQAPKLVIQTGHAEVINKILYTPDGNHLITCSDDYTIKIWEIASGKEMRTLFAHTKRVNEIATSPDGSKIISVSDDRKIIVWDFKTGEVIKEIKEHDNQVLTVDYSPTGDYFATGSKDKTVRLYNASTYKGKELYKFNSEVNKIKFLNDGEHLYTETDQLLSKNAFFSIPNGKMITWIPGGGATAIDFDSKNEKFLAARDFGQPSVNIIKDWKKIQDWKKNKEPLWKSIVPYNFQDTTGDFQILKTKGKENFDFTKSEVKDGGTVASSYPVSAFFSKDGNDDIVAGNHLGDLLFWKYDDIKYFPRTVNPYAKLNQKLGNMYVKPFKVINAHTSPILDAVSSLDGKYILTSAKNSEMKLWDVKSENNIQTFTNGLVKPISSVAFDSNKSLVIISASANERYLVDLSKMEIVEKFEHKEFFERICLSQNGKTALVSFYNSSYFHLMNFKTKEVIKTFKGHLGEITSLVFSNDETKAISTATEGKKITWNLSNGEKTKSEITTFSALSSPENGSKIEYNKLNATLTSAGKSVNLPHYNRVTALGFTSDEKFAFTSSSDGSVNLWHPVSGDLVAKLMITNEDELIGITSDNYFMASPSALKSIAFLFNDKMYPFEQFDLVFNRPDLFLKKTGYADQVLIDAFEKVYERRRKLSGANVEPKQIFDAPVVNVNYSSFTKTSYQENLKFSLKAVTDGSVLKQLIVKVNGVPDQEIKTSGSTKEIEVSIKLSEGINKIEVTAENVIGIKSLTQNFEVSYLPEISPTKDLHLITIGVSKYENSDFNLNYAEKDAKDIANIFKQSAGKSYANVFHYELLNDQVTSENIRNLSSKLAQSKVNDHVIFFFAGHGLLSSDLNYFLATYPTDFNQPETKALAYAEIENLLSVAPSRNKIILIDACHSGEVDKEQLEVTNEVEDDSDTNLVFRGFQGVRSKNSSNLGMLNTFQLMKSAFSDLRENTGTIVISSAGGAEYALESDEWNNGVFTYYIKKGLLNKEADLDKSGVIYASELQKYVAKQVSKATNGKQQPTMRVQNLKNDVPVWKKNN